jgi:adenine phosphoribosyltransferase
MTSTSNLDLGRFIRTIPDFPKPGILFRDITPLLADAAALRQAVKQLADPFRGQAIDVVAAAEARGFIFAAPLAIELGKGFVPVRKPGKLPYETRRFQYDLEYGNDTLEIHSDGVRPGERVLLVDDLLATGGTMQACCRLVEQCGAAIVACAFVIELTGLCGAQKIVPHKTYSLLKYE